MKKKGLMYIFVFLFAVVFFESVNTTPQVTESLMKVESTQPLPSLQSELLLDAPAPDAVGYTAPYYNLADEYLIVADNQTSVGLCWSFATTKVIETYLAVNFGEYYNFSEGWVSLAYRYYINHNYLGVNDLPNYMIGDGGHYVTYMNAINTYGIMLETDFPYETIYSIGEDNYEEYFNAYKDLAKTDLINDLDFGYWGDYNSPSSNKEEIMSYMKDYLTMNGGIYCAIYASSFGTNVDGTTYCLTTTNTITTHAMTIIGWDDNYSCTVGATTYTGAWITLNSYGADGKYVYVMYDDTNVSKTNVAISSMSYNGITVDVDNPINYAGLLLSSSNSNYTNLDIASNTKIQKNLFQYNETIRPSLTYDFSSSYANPDFDYTVTADNFDKTNLFALSVDDINKTITFTATSIVEPGYYTFEIFVDKNSDGTVDETYVKTLAVLSGAEIEYVRSYSNYIEKEVMYQNQNTLLKYGTTYYGFSKANFLLLEIIVSDYSKIASYSVSGITPYITHSSTNFVPANVSSYATGMILLQFNFTNQVALHNSTLTLTTLDGYDFEYLIKIFRYSDAETNYITKINYFVDGGVNSNINANATILSSDISNLFYKQYLETPTKQYYTFMGWYFESTFVNILPNDVNGYYLTYNSVMNSLSGLNCLYNYYLPYYSNGINYAILFANWELTNYDITYNLDGGVNSPSNPSQYNFETATITLQAPTKIGYTFLGWTGEGILSPTTFVQITKGSSGDKEYTANWEENSYIISYNSNGGVGGIASTEVVYSDDFTTANFNSGIFNPDTNKELTGWRIQGTETILDLNTLYSVSSICEYADVVEIDEANIVLLAEWEYIVFNITYTLFGGENSAQNPSTYTYNTPTFSLQAPTQDGYTFTGWTGEGIMSPTMTVTITQGSTGDKQYVANWQENLYMIEYNSNGGTGSIASQMYYYSQSFTTAGLDDGISHTDASEDLTGWRINETDYVLELDTLYSISLICEYAGVENEEFASIILYADWVVEVYTVNFYDFDGTTLLRTEEKPRGTDFNFSDYTTTKTSTDKYTYTFAGWYGSSIFEGEPINNIVVTHDVDLFVKFDTVINKYTIALYDNENELIENKIFDYDTVLVFYTLSGEDKIYNQDFVVEKQDTTVQEFTFAGWYNSLDYINELSGFTVTQNRNIYAKYLIVNKEFVINVYDEDGRISSTISYTYGDTAYDLTHLTIEKESTAQYTYSFAGWYDNADYSGEPLSSISITENYSLENLYPLFTETIRTYLIYLYEDNSFDTIYRTLTYDYGQTINLNNISITKQSDEYYYTFLGWYNTSGVLQSSNITVTENLSFYAEFSATKIFIQLNPDSIEIIKIIGASLLGIILLTSMGKIIKTRRINKFNRERAKKVIQEIRQKQEQNRK